MGQIIGEGITFDDVLLVPAYSEVIPNQVDLTTSLTQNIKLNIPWRVPECYCFENRCYCHARQGGIGVIHKNIQ
jgi:IMP dehydrogenase